LECTSDLFRNVSLWDKRTRPFAHLKAMTLSPSLTL